MAFVDVDETMFNELGGINEFNRIGHALDDAEAEVAALKEEIASIKENNGKLTEELDKTKKMNFSLASRLDVNKDKKSFGETLFNEFLGGNKK